MEQKIYCPVYRCRLSVFACATRHLHSISGSSWRRRKTRPGTDDPNCRMCADGKARAAASGTAELTAYHKQMLDCRKNAINWRASTKTPIIREVKSMTNPKQDLQEPPSKPCCKCLIPKPLESGFSKSTNTQDGYKNQCKECRLKAGRERREAKRLAAGNGEVPEKRPRTRKITKNQTIKSDISISTGHPSWMQKPISF